HRHCDDPRIETGDDQILHRVGLRPLRGSQPNPARFSRRPRRRNRHPRNSTPTIRLLGCIIFTVRLRFPRVTTRKGAKTMIHIVEGLGTPADQPLLESMFEDRKRLFIDLLDWDLTVVDDRLEVDRFDDAYATYIIAADHAGRHLA